MGTASAQGTAARTDWSRLQRIAFRVAFVYLLLDTVPRAIDFLPDLMPGIPALPAIDGFLWRPIVPWVGKHILHLPRDITILAGYDTAYGNVLMLCRLGAALIAAAVWTLVDKKHGDYRNLHYALRVLLRYDAAFTMLLYAFSKIIQQQFPSPNLVTMISPFGYLNPHQLLWSMMGFSRIYQVISGSVECLGALLLFFRRTTTLGALITTAALANVFVLDWSYGVFVKVIALQLMIAAVFLVVPDVPRLANVLIFHRPVMDAFHEGPVYTNAWLRRGLGAFKAALIVCFITMPAADAYRTQRDQLARNVATPPLYGLYSVVRFTRNGAEVPSTDPQRWTLVALDGPAKDYSVISVRREDETWLQHLAKYDKAKRTLTMGADPPAQQVQFDYNRTPEGVVFRGQLEGATVEIALRRIAEPKFPLNDPTIPRWFGNW